MRRKGTSLKVNFIVHYPQEDKDKYYITDKLRLTQILSNLIDNAVKFTDQGLIEVGYIHQDENSLLFYVKDTGIGMANHQLNVIFDRFRQLDDSYTRNYGGTGLGLNIVKNLVFLMGGKLNVESEIGQGSFFSFSIPCPLYKKFQNEISIDTIKSEKRNLDGKTILVVEDDLINRYYLEIILKKLNLNVIIAENGGEAVEIVRERKSIDLILMDLKLPILDGYEATKIIKQENPDIPIVAQTAYAFEEEISKIMAVGCDAYILKPINQSELLNTLNHFIQ